MNTFASARKEAQVGQINVMKLYFPFEAHFFVLSSFEIIPSRKTFAAEDLWLSTNQRNFATCIRVLRFRQDPVTFLWKAPFLFMAQNLFSLKYILSTSVFQNPLCKHDPIDLFIAVPCHFKLWCFWIKWLASFRKIVMK